MTEQRKQVAGAGAMSLLVTGLGAVGFLLAGVNDAPRQETAIPAQARSVPTVLAPVETPTVSGSALPDPLPIAPAPPPPPPPPQPATPTPKPSLPPPTTRPPAPRRLSPLAAAWLAAGAQNIDVDAGLPGPSGHRAGTGPPAVRIEIPSIGVAAAVDPTGLNSDGTLAVPKDFARTAYYTGRPNPGEVGPSIIIGHVDNRSGPAVFFRLDELEPGDEVVVERADAARVTFVVERS